MLREVFWFSELRLDLCDHMQKQYVDEYQYHCQYIDMPVYQNPYMCAQEKHNQKPKVLESPAMQLHFEWMKSNVLAQTCSLSQSGRT